MSTPRYRSEPPALSGSAICVSNAMTPSRPGMKSDIGVSSFASPDAGLAAADPAAQARGDFSLRADLPTQTPLSLRPGHDAPALPPAATMPGPLCEDLYPWRWQATRGAGQPRASTR